MTNDTTEAWRAYLETRIERSAKSQFRAICSAVGEIFASERKRHDAEIKEIRAEFAAEMQKLRAELLDEREARRLRSVSPPKIV